MNTDLGEEPRRSLEKNLSSSHFENSECVRRDYVADPVVMLLMVSSGNAGDIDRLEH